MLFVNYKFWSRFVLVIGIIIVTVTYVHAGLTTISTDVKQSVLFPMIPLKDIKNVYDGLYKHGDQYENVIHFFIETFFNNNDNAKQQCLTDFQCKKLIQKIVRHPTDTQILNDALIEAAQMNNDILVEILVENDAYVDYNYARYEIFDEIRYQQQITSLHWAARHGNIKMVNTLLKHQANVEETSAFDGATPLHLAASANDDQNHVDVTIALLKHGANIEAKDTNDKTALHLAAARNLPNIVKILLQFNAQLNSQDKEGNTPLHDAAMYLNENIAIIFLNYQVSVAIANDNGFTPLHLVAATKHGNFQTNKNEKITTMIKILLEYGATLDTTDANGNTALHIAISKNIIDNVKILLSFGLETIETTNNDGETPLILATRQHFVDIINVLLDHNANINAQDRRFGCTALYWAVGYGFQEKTAITLLNNHAVDVTISCASGSTPLHSAVQHRIPIYILEIILRKGETSNIINMKNNHGETPLHSAAKFGIIDNLELLLHNGAKVNDIDNDDNTPLHFACEFTKPNNKDVINILLKYGANIEARNKDGETPLITAARQYWETRTRRPDLYDISDAITQLIYHGANIHATDKHGHKYTYYNQRGYYPYSSF